MIVLLYAAVSAAALARTGAPSCFVRDTDLRDSSVFHPTIPDLKRIAEGYRLPSVVGFWQAMQDYQLGVAEKQTATSLKALDRTHYTDSFFIMSNRHSLGGGDNLTIIFKEHPSDLYWVWMYHLSTGVWQVRNFEVETCSAAQLNWIRKKFRVLFAPPPSPPL